MLSHPLLVEAIENEFVPVAIHNNKKGKDAEILKRYEEPAWNNPVVRYLDSNGVDLIERKDRVWDLAATAARMAKALEAAGKEAPPYLGLLAEQTNPGKKLGRATFAMHCFWEGEVAFGAVPGVLRTRAGWLEGKEVVEVEFNRDLLSYEDLLEHAQRQKCASTVYAHGASDLESAKKLVGQKAKLAKAQAKDAKASDRKYHLRRSPLRFLPLAPAQRCRVNSALAKKQDPLAWLSPRQRKLAGLLRSSKMTKKQVELLADLQPPEKAADFLDYEKKLRQLLAPPRRKD